VTSMILSQIVNGFSWGMILGLLALGLTVIFGMLNIINFAHGAIYAISIYLAYTFIYIFHIPIPFISTFWGTLIIVPILMGFLGIVIERFLIKPMLTAQHEYQLLLTFSLLLILQEAIAIIWGTKAVPFDCPKSLVGVLDLKFMVYPIYRIFVIIITVIIAAVFWFFLEKTKYGSVIRGGIEDSEMMSCLGINISLVRNLTFGLGIAVAALSGVLSAPIAGTLCPLMGMTNLITCFVIIAIGGLGSFLGAIVGGILVGILKSLMIMIEPKASQLVMFFLMAVVLLLRPRGLFGKR
jgi:branched-chain amino acid transport system permease protein